MVDAVDVQPTQLVLNCCLFIMLRMVRIFVFSNCKKDRKRETKGRRKENEAHLVQKASANRWCERIDS